MEYRLPLFLHFPLCFLFMPLLSSKRNRKGISAGSRESVYHHALGNQFHSRMKFVVHSHHKIHWFGIFSLAWFLHHIRYACASYPRLHNLWFTHCLQSRMKFVFSLHDTRMKFHTRTRVSFTQIENRNDSCGNQKVVLASSKKIQKNYLKMGWARSRMKVILVSCE